MTSRARVALAVALAVVTVGGAPSVRAEGSERAIERLSCVQLDSITTVERSHRIALGARIGDYPRETVSRQLWSSLSTWLRKPQIVVTGSNTRSR